MKPKLLLLLAIFSAGICQAQKNETRKDSIRHRNQTLGNLRKEYNDSMMHDPRYKALFDTVMSNKSASNHYTAFELYTEVSSADYAKLNADNALSGFKPIQGQSWAIGAGISFKDNRSMFDLNIGAFGIPKKIKKQEEKIRANFSNFLQLQWGYDILKGRAVNIYPFIGLGLRDYLLNYETNTIANSNPTNISNIIVTNNSAQDERTQLGYQAGIAIDVLLTKRNSTAGTFAFLKVGTNRAFSKKSFDYSGQKYNPKFNYGEWSVTVGFKFFGRR